MEGASDIVDGRIEAFGRDVAPQGDQVIDATGRTVLPGLINAHFHAYGIDLNTLTLDSRPLSCVTLLTFATESVIESLSNDRFGEF